MTAPAMPSPALLFDAINGHQRTAAIRAAIELDLFTAIGSEPATAREIAERCKVAEKGARVLCDYLTILGFLVKQDGRYGLTRDTAVFLDRRSPAYLGGTFDFYMHPMIMGGFQTLADAVRKGGTVVSEEGTVSPENPVWVVFARAIAPVARPTAEALAALLPFDPSRPLKVLDIAAGHGIYGISVAKRFPKAEVVALDWPNVLEVAKENAEAAGVLDRFRALPGSAFDVPFGEGYDLVLVTNFLHHFDVATCEGLLRKVHASLADGGKAATVEFVPNEDRVSPPEAASFSLVMLTSTPRGDAYTFSELDAMLKTAGFSKNELHRLPVGIGSIVLSDK